jgi:hypothetical protein
MNSSFKEFGWVPGESSFSAAEVAAITGMPLNLQRVWRSRGQLPGGIGKQARFSSQDVAEILVRHHLALNGIPPSESDVIGRDAARQVLCFALMDSGGACEVLGLADHAQHFLQLFMDKAELAQELAGVSSIAQYLWRCEGGELMLVSDLANITDERRAISGSFVDLEVAADQLVERAGRPLFSINVSPGSYGRRVRRVTNGRVRSLTRSYRADEAGLYAEPEMLLQGA